MTEPWHTLYFTSSVTPGSYFRRMISKNVCHLGQSMFQANDSNSNWNLSRDSNSIIRTQFETQTYDFQICFLLYKIYFLLEVKQKLKLGHELKPKLSTENVTQTNSNWDENWKLKHQLKLGIEFEQKLKLKLKFEQILYSNLSLNQSSNSNWHWN